MRSEPPTRYLIRLLAFLSIGFFLDSEPAASQSASVVLRGATIITVGPEGVLENGAVVVEGGRITWIGPAADLEPSSGSSILDATGQWIIPGLIDTNVHLILTTVPEFYVRYEEDLVDIAIQSAQIGLKYGMTTMADSWGPLNPLIEARDRIRQGEFVGSDVLVAGNIIGTGGPFTPYFMEGWGLRGKSLRYGDWVTPVIQDRINRLWEADMGPGLMALTPDELAQRMRSYIDRGVDFVKLGISGHGIEPVEPLMFTDAQLDAMVGVIREAGVPFQTHTFTIPSLAQAVRLRPDLLQHPNVMSPSWLSASDLQKQAIREQIDAIRDTDILSGLMSVPEKEQLRIYQAWESSMTDDAALDEIMRYRQAWYEGVDYDMMASGLRVWLAADIPYTIATDQGPEDRDLGPTVWGRMGRAHFDRMVGLQDAGAQPIDILRAATLNGAAAYRLDEDRGSLEVGKRADLLILGSNPLEDIANVRDIIHVMQRGVLIDREALPVNPILDYDPELPWPY